MSRAAVVIPNRNRAELLERALASVAAQSVPPARVVVADNGSTDDSAGVARRAGAQLLQLPENRGFAAAVNAGVRECDEEWVLILNNDAELDTACLEALLETAARRQAACAAPRLLSFSNPSQLDGCWDLLSRGGAALRCGHGVPDGPAWQTERRILFAPLTATLVRRELCRLDEAFGSYLEDIDLSLRLNLTGHSLWYSPQALVRHHGSATDGAWSPRMVTQIARNQLLLAARHYPGDWWRREAWAMLVAQTLWGFAAARHGRTQAWLRGKWLGLRAWSACRTPAAEPERLRALLGESELELRAYTRAHPSWYWRIYRALTRSG
jgi:GT2 family glycosyltransferase